MLGATIRIANEPNERIYTDVECVTMHGDKYKYIILHRTLPTDSLTIHLGDVKLYTYVPEKEYGLEVLHFHIYAL